MLAKTEINHPGNKKQQNKHLIAIITKENNMIRVGNPLKYCTFTVLRFAIFVFIALNMSWARGFSLTLTYRTIALL